MVGEAANDADEIETILEEAQRLIKQADNRPPFSTPEDSNSALSTLRKARDLYRQVGGTQEEQANCLHVIGRTLGAMGRHEEAVAAYREALGVYYRLLDSGRDRADCLHELGDALNEQGRYEEALVAYQGALDIYHRDGGGGEREETCLNRMRAVVEKIEQRQGPER